MNQTQPFLARVANGSLVVQILVGIIGRIVLITIREGRMLIQADLHVGQEPTDAPVAKRKRRLFEQVVATVNDGFQENFPE